MTKDLGAILDSKQTNQNQIYNRISKASKILGFILRNNKVFKHNKTKLILYNAFVRSQLEYCTIVAATLRYSFFKTGACAKKISMIPITQG